MVVSPRPPAHEHGAGMLDLVFDALPDRLAVLGAGGGIARVNAAWTAHGGVQPARGRTYRDICESLELGYLTTERIKAGVLRVLEGQAPVFREEFVQEGNRHAELTAVALEKDARRGVLLTLADVTVRRQAEESRRNDRLLLDKIVENIPTSVHVKAVGDDLRIVLWNKAAESLYGVSRSEAIGRNVHELWPPEAAAAMAAADRELLEKGGRQEFLDRPACTRHGREVLVHMRKVLIHDESGVATHMLIIADDVTEQRRKEAAMRASEERFRRLTAMSSDWYWQQDAQFRFIYFSGTDEGSPFKFRSGVEGKTRWEIPGLEPLSSSWEEHRAVLQARQPFRDFQYKGVHTDGTPVFLSINGEPVFDSEGSFTGYWGTARNITARKKAQREILELNTQLEERVRQRTGQLELANRELQAFAYSVAHDLRGPLISINGFTHLIGRNRGASPEAESARERALDRIRSQVQHMDELTTGLLSLAQLLRTELDWAPSDIGAMARLAVDRLAGLEPGRDVQVIIEPGLVLDCDRVLMTQVMDNLVANAWKFTAHSKPAVIRVGMELDGQGRRCCFVEDNGVGFDKALATKMFGAFQRFHAVHEFEGTGLGLAIVHRIVTRHGGRVWADSAPGKGAKFSFTLGEAPPHG
ncbi:MAG: PAS domain-containing protein [Pseudomonadota bacterium]